MIYAEALEKAGWLIDLPIESIGHQVMAVFVDVYGNEAREVIPGSKFGALKAKRAAKSAKGKKKGPKPHGPRHSENDVHADPSE